MKKADAYEQSGTHTCTARCVRVESAPTAIGCQKWTFVRGSRDRQDGELRLGQDLCVSTIKKGFYSLFYERKTPPLRSNLTKRSCILATSSTIGWISYRSPRP